MKKISIFLCALFVAMTAQADSYTLDVSTAADVMLQPINYQPADEIHYQYSIKNVWDSTYSENALCQLIYCNEGKFSFTHLPSGNSWGGTSWEGFTVSKVASDTTNAFGCMAKGGLKGEGTPFIVGYFSEYYTMNNTESFPSSNIVYFDDSYYPQEVYICQSTNTMKALKDGMAPARAFTKKDTLTLIISGLNNLYEEVSSVEYYLAIDSVFNTTWTKVDLSPLGNVAGLSFRMTSTDMSYGYMNTPSYFALDGLKIGTETSTGSENIATPASQTKKMLINGRIVIERNNTRYTIDGQRIE